MYNVHTLYRVYTVQYNYLCTVLTVLMEEQYTSVYVQLKYTVLFKLTQVQISVLQTLFASSYTISRFANQIAVLGL